MEINENRVYVNLRTDEGVPVMNISRMTAAVRDIGLSCGDVLRGEKAAVSPITVEYCQLDFMQLRAFMTNLSLTRQEFCARFAVTPEQLEIWESQRV